MVALFIEGFDKYGAPSETAANIQTLMAGEWTTFAINSIIAPLSANGQALGLGTGGGGMVKTIGGPYNRLIGGFRFASDLARTTGIQAQATGTAEWSVTINTTGLISIRTGNTSGTAIATTSTGAISANAVHYLEWDVTRGASGAYNVYLDGTLVLTGTGNTGATDINQIAIIGSSNAGGFKLDDLYLFDSTGGENNAPLLTNPIVETTYATADSAVAFTFSAGTLGPDYSLTTNTNAPGANELFLRKFTPGVAATINSVSCLPAATSAGANLKAVIYSDSAGAPHTLLSSGTQVTGTTSGTLLTGALTTPQALTAGTPYWIGFITDTSVALTEVDTTTTGEKAANTYTSGAPGTAPTMTAGQASWMIFGNVTGVTGNNWSASAQNPPTVLGDLSYVSSSTVGQEDLYTWGALPVTPSAIYTAAVKAFCRNTDAGVRTVSMRTKSGSTDSGGSLTGQTPAQTYGWLSSYFDTDPNTSAAWGTTALNSATSGMKVDS